MQDVLLSPIFVFYRMPFSAIQVFYVELAEHVIHKFGFIACFVTIQVKCINHAGAAKR